MADVTNFSLFGQTVNIKDAVARNTASKALNRTGNGVDFSKTVIIGDSFAGDSFGYSPWSHVFRDMIDGECNIFSFGGSGFVATGLRNKSFADGWTDVVVPGVTNIGNVTCVIVQGGVNDYNQTTDAEKAGVARLLTKIKESCPKARIFGITNTMLFQPYRTTWFGIQQGFANAGVPNTVNGWCWMLNRRELFGDDELHPNENGMVWLAHAIYNFITAGVETPEYSGGFIGGLGGGIMYTIVNGALQFFGYGNSTSTENSQDIGTIGNFLKPSQYIAIPCYTDGGTASWVSIDTTGKVGIYKKDTTSAIIGKWRVIATVPITMQ